MKRFQLVHVLALLPIAALAVSADAVKASTVRVETRKPGLQVEPSANGFRELLFADSLAGRSFGRTTEVRFDAEGAEKVAVLATPSASIEYAAGCFENASGEIEFDVKLTEPPAPNHKFWTLFSDVGSGGSHPGAVNIHWRDGSNKLEFMLFDGREHHACVSKTTDWKVGKWYRLAFGYGRNGMSLRVDGKLEDTNSFAEPLSETPKKLGFHDDVVDAPPVKVRNFRTYRVYFDSVRAVPPVFTPNGDGLTDECKVHYTLATNSQVSIEVVDAAGKLVKRLLDKSPAARGDHEVVWNGENAKAGKYTIRVSTVSNQNTRRLSTPVEVDLRWKWKKSAPALNGFFPVAVWYFWEEDASYINTHVDDADKAQAYYDSTSKQLAEHGVNLIVANWTPHDHRKMMLDACQRNGIKAILHLDEVNSFIAHNKIEDGYKLFDIAEKAIRDYRNHPAVAAYYIIDEPWNTPEQTEKIAFAKKVLEAMDPEHPGLSCLLNAYEPTLKQVDYQALVIDIYPIGRDWKGGDLSVFAKEAERGRVNAGDRPLWVILQSFGTRGGWRVPTPAEVEAQVWLSLAAGAKGIFYFMYQSTTAKQGEWIDGWVKMDMTPSDDRMAEIGKVNGMLKKLAPLMLKLKPGDFALPSLPASVYANRFVGPDGARYLIVANKSTVDGVELPSIGSCVDTVSGEKFEGPIRLEPGKGRVLKLAGR